jgi:hypothetical protein
MLVGLYFFPPIQSPFWDGRGDTFAYAIWLSIVWLTSALVGLAWCVNGRLRWRSRSRRVLGWASSANAKSDVELLGLPILFACVHYAVSAINLGWVPSWGPAVSGLIAVIAYFRWLLLPDRHIDSWREQRRVWLESIGKS